MLNDKQIAFANSVKASLLDAYSRGETSVNAFRKNNLEKLARQYGIQDPTHVKELVEYAIVMAARSVIELSSSGPEGNFNNLVRLYKTQPLISHRSSMSTIYQQYSTPIPLAYIAGVYAGMDKLGCEGGRVNCKKGYEPSAGNGLFTIAADPKNILVNEIDNFRADVLESQGYSSVSRMDASSAISFIGSERLYHSVVSNPPFDKLKTPIKYNGTQFGVLDHLMAAIALELMADDGKAAIIVGGHTEYDELGRIKAGKNRKFIAYLYHHYNVEDTINIDGSLYAKQGTQVNIRLILINGRKETPGGFPPLFQNLPDYRTKTVETFDQLFDRIALLLKPDNSNNDKMKNLKLKARAAKVKLGLLDTGLGAPYQPISDSCNILDVHVPDSMNYEIHNALKQLQKQVGDVTEYVRKKLHYTTSTELCKSLAAEQIDAVGLGIYNFENKGQGIIIGDQTGIGKGRQAAAFIRYAVFELKVKPIFLTEKPNLFSDIYRDLNAIGCGDFKPFIVNTAEEKSKVKDDSGTVVYEAPPKATQSAIIQNPKEKLSGYQYIMATYSQFNRNKKLESGQYELDDKGRFLLTMSENNLFVLDESHNASGASNTGMFLAKCVAQTKGTLFLSATFAKRPDNMLIYAMKTSLQDSNLSDEDFVQAFERGGVALQEVVSSQLVLEGQMIRRERTYEGVQVNYMNLDERSAEHKAISDRITGIIRDIIHFQEEYIDGEIKKQNKILAAEMASAEKTSGTSKAGVDNTPYFSKVFNIINQMLFSIKAEDVANHAITRLKEGKKVVIAFSSTMGAFLDEMDTGDVIPADFSEVLGRGLKSTLRYTEKDAMGEPTHKFIPLSQLSPQAQEEYHRITNKIKTAATGITISPIDVLVSILTKAGYKVAEVTGRSKELVFGASEKQIEKANKDRKPKKKEGPLTDESQIPSAVRAIMHPRQVMALVESGTEEHWGIFESLYMMAGQVQNRSLEKERAGYEKVHGTSQLDYSNDVARPILHYFNHSSDWYVYEWDTKYDEFFGYGILNGDYQNAEWGYISREELLADYGLKSFELDFFYDPVPISEVLEKGMYGLGNVSNPLPKSSFANTALVQARKKENATDAFRKFQDNEVDVLLINQSGSTGASAHAIPTKKVAKDDVKQRVMIVLQAELDINREVQKRGRINRTGQILKPIYDYLTSTIPAEQRLMMMLQRKLKSLDANTSSNQKQSKDLLDVPDFLNKYGDLVVYQYLLDNPEINKMLGNPLKFSEGEEEVSNPKAEAMSGAAHKVSGRVAILDVKQQEDFYSNIISNYEKYVTALKQSGEYDLEMETMDLQAETIEHQLVMVNPAPGKSVFADHSYLELIEANNLKKPYKKAEVEAMVEQALSGYESAQEYQRDIIQHFEAFMEKRLVDTQNEINLHYDTKIEEIETEPGYLKQDAELRPAYKAKRHQELTEARKMKLEKNQSAINNQQFYLNQFFRYYYPGKSIMYPTVLLDSGAAFSPAVFLGFDIDKNKKNPYAPSAITASVAIAGSMKRADTALSGDFGQRLITAKSYSTNVSPRENIDRWDELISKSNRDRVKRYVITGNLLQVVAKSVFKGGALISYTVKGGGVKKGYLMPESWVPNFESNGRLEELKIPVPVYMARDFIKAYASTRNPITTTDNLTFMRNYNGEFTVNVPVSRSQGGKFFQFIPLVDLTIGRNFNKTGNLMVASVEDRDIEKVLKLLQDEFKLNVEMTQAEFDREMKSIDHGKLPEALPEVKVEKPLPAEEPEERIHVVQLPKYDFKEPQPDKLRILKLKAKAAKAKLMLLDLDAA